MSKFDFEAPPLGLPNALKAVQPTTSPGAFFQKIRHFFSGISSRGLGFVAAAGKMLLVNDRIIGCARCNIACMAPPGFGYGSRQLIVLFVNHNPNL